MMVNVENKRIVIIGSGRSGICVAKCLMEKGAEVTVSDAAPKEKIQDAITKILEMGASVEYGGHTNKTLLSADMIVLSPGVPHTLNVLEDAKKKGIKILGEVELAFHLIEAPIIAITGTNGKTTTTELIGHMLKTCGFSLFMGGNIGVPLTSYADLKEDKDVVVAEISSFQTDTMEAFRPKIGLFLNVTEDHLDRYPSFDKYIASKKRLFKNQRSDDVAILNYDDPNVYELKDQVSSEVLGFSSRRQEKNIPFAFINKNRIDIQGCKRFPSCSIDLKNATLIGPHNHENIAAAALSCLAFGGNIEGIQRAVDTFKGLPHRMESVLIKNGVHYINDSKATNVDAVKRALECFQTPVILIMGGRNKDNDFKMLSGDIDAKVKEIILMGEAKDEIRGALTPAFQKKAIMVETMRDAIQRAIVLGELKDTVLLSPACASFDMYLNYEKRGEDFKNIVLELLR